MRYTTIIDISEYPSYSNPNTRLLYLHLALKRAHQSTIACPVDTVATSYRKLAQETGLTLSAVRYSLESLEIDGLITVAQTATHDTAQEAAQTATRRATRRATQPTTHIHVLSFSELQGGCDTRSNIDSDTKKDIKNDAISDTASGTNSNTLTNNEEFKQDNKKSLSHTHEEEAFFIEEKVEEIAAAVNRSVEDTTQLCETFIKQCKITSTTHKDKTDALKHCISWIMKQPVRKRQPKATKQSDGEIRKEQEKTTQELIRENQSKEEVQIRRLASKIPTPTNMSAKEFAQFAIAVKKVGIHQSEKHFGPVAWQSFKDACKSIKISAQTLLDMIE